MRKGLINGPNGLEFRTLQAPRFPSVPRIVRDSSPISWIDEPAGDEFGQLTIGYYGGWAVQINTMIFNDRLVLADPRPLGQPWYGWCYQKGGAAALAALAWNPEEDGEPAGYKKAALSGRIAGERAPWWHPPMA